MMVWMVFRQPTAKAALNGKSVTEMNDKQLEIKENIKQTIGNASPLAN